LKGSVQTDHALNNLVWRRIFVTGKRDTNAEPPSEGLPCSCQSQFHLGNQG
jgi:hypothetical protein